MKDDILHPEGVFDPFARFAFTNITKEDFKSFWNSQPITVKPGQTVKLKHHLAVKFLKELVDKIMQGEAKMDEVAYYERNQNAAPNSYRSPKGLQMGVPAARKVWEDQIIKQLPTEKDTVEFELMKQEFMEEIERDTNAKVSTEPIPVPSATLSHSDHPTQLPSEFAELK